MKTQYRDKAYFEYQQFNQQWLLQHSRIMYISSIVGLGLELVLMIFIYAMKITTISVRGYLLKYVFIPALINLAMCFLSRLVIKNERLLYRQKSYLLCFFTVVITFVFATVHNIFVSVLIVLGLPILISTVYEDERLTTFIALISVLLMVLSGCFIKYDLDKVVNSIYILNMVVLLVIDFILLIISHYIIRFNERKREVTIQGNIERFDLEKRIYLDGLTLVGNKSAFEKDLDDIVEDDDNIYYLAIFDIDLFKQFNDQHGHLFGDSVLVQVGNLLLKNMPEIKSYRYGGDEFCMIFKNHTEVEVLEKIRKLQKNLKRNIINGTQIPVTISVGICKKVIDDDKNSLISKTDLALYQSKDSGRDKITLAKEKVNF